MPNRRRLPPAFGIIRSRTGTGRNVRARRSARRSARKAASPRLASIELAVWPCPRPCSRRPKPDVDGDNNNDSKRQGNVRGDQSQAEDRGVAADHSSPMVNGQRFCPEISGQRLCSPRRCRRAGAGRSRSLSAPGRSTRLFRRPGSRQSLARTPSRSQGPDRAACEMLGFDSLTVGREGNSW
jgi:hypothetical protein